MPAGGEKFGAWYDRAAADAAVAFFPTYLRHTEAEWFGLPFRLLPWQEQIVRQIFGWKRADGTRLIRQVWIEVPRKNGKTEFAAGLALLVLVADGEFGGQAYSMACDKDQARIVFDKAGVMVGLSPALAEVLEVYKTSVFCPSLLSSFKPLSSRASTKHGFSVSFAIGDEVHEWPDGVLHDVVHKGTGARRQPLEVLITTAGEPGIGYGWEMHERAELIQKGEIEDPSFLVVIFAAEPEDDWTAPETWAKANPSMPVSPKADYLAGEVAAAIGNPRKIADFKRFHLNIWNDRQVSGLDMAAWDACPSRAVTLESLRGRRVFGGIDLAATTDLNALCLAAYGVDWPGIDYWWMFWMPVGAPGSLRERVRRDRVDYEKWIGDGWITGTEGNVADYDLIRATITGKGDRAEAFRDGGGVPLVEQLEIVDVAVDMWNATQIVSQLGGDGLVMVPFGQGFKSMSPPSKEFDRRLVAREIGHGGNPVARYMASCTSFATDAAENMKPVKPDRRRTPKRIDGIVAGIMATARLTAEAPTTKSWWETAAAE